MLSPVLPFGGLRRNIPLLMGNLFCADLRLFYPISVLAFQSLTGSFALAMGVFTIMGLTQVLFEVPMGVLSDKWGRRRTLIMGSLMEFTGCVFYAAAFFSALPLLWLYAGGALIGLAESLFSGNNDAMLFETLKAYRKTKEFAPVMGRYTSVGQAALALSGILASVCLALGASFQSLFLLSLIPVGFSLVLACATIEPPRAEQPVALRSRDHMRAAFLLLWHNPRLCKFAVATALTEGLGKAIHSFMPSFIQTVWPLALTPLYRTAQNSVGAIGFWLSGLCVKRLGVVRVLLGTSLITPVFNFMAFWMANLFSPLLLLVTQITYALRQTADKTVQQQNFSTHQRSTMGSLIALLTAGVSGIASVLVGLLADVLSPSWALLLFVGAGLPATALYFSLFRNEPSAAHQA